MTFRYLFRCHAVFRGLDVADEGFVFSKCNFRSAFDRPAAPDCPSARRSAVLLLLLVSKIRRSVPGWPRSSRNARPGGGGRLDESQPPTRTPARPIFARPDTRATESGQCGPRGRSRTRPQRDRDSGFANLRSRCHQAELRRAAPAVGRWQSVRAMARRAGPASRRTRGLREGEDWELGIGDRDRDSGFGIRDSRIGNWRLGIGSWEVGSWEVGS
jgi:hypothetical protein